MLIPLLLLLFLSKSNFALITRTPAAAAAVPHIRFTHFHSFCNCPCLPFIPIRIPPSTFLKFTRLHSSSNSQCQKHMRKINRGAPTAHSDPECGAREGALVLSRRDFGPADGCGLALVSKLLRLDFGLCRLSFLCHACGDLRGLGCL
jgi:hypothetical protein